MFEKFPNKNKKMIIKGAGKFMAKIPGCSELVTLGHMTNMRLDIQLDMVDIEGGDTPVPLDTLLRKKVIDVTAEDAKFDLNMVRLVLGSKLREGVNGLAYEMENEEVTVTDNSGSMEAPVTGTISTSHTDMVQVFNQTTGEFVSDFTTSGSTVTINSGATADDELVIYYPVDVDDEAADGFLWVLEEKHKVEDDGNGNGEIDFNFPLHGANEGQKRSHVSVRLYKENKLLKRASSQTPGEGEYYVDVTNGKVIFNEYLIDEDIYVNYKRPEVVDVLDISKKDYPITCHIVHDGQFEQKDGSVQGYQTELFMCRVKSNFTLDAARQTAATHSVTLTVIDPERPDDKLGTIKRYEIPADPEDC